MELLYLLENICLDIQKNMDELSLVKKMIEGDRKTFRYFFDKYYSDLCNFVNVYINDKSLSEEVVQDVFVYFWENKSRIKIRSSAQAYLFGASKYRSLNLLREQKNRNRASMALFDNIEKYDEQSQDYFTNTDELQKVIQHAVQQLPERCREIFILSKQHDLSNKEIAEQLNISVKTVENQITIALRKLRENLAPFREKIFVLFIANL